ncbi:MAG: DUF1932 domain-containing protein [Thalassovita sp.]|nr:DUF1932 domain-containing protein [Thalassovita sp.]
MPNKIAFIGLGEAASAIISGLGDDLPPRISAYDIKSDDPGTAPEIENRAAGLGITCCACSADAIGDADIVFCTVTADQALSAAETGARHIRTGAYWCDLNSCAPSSKQAASEMINAAGGRYVDVAVMAPVHPGLNMVPCLLSGPHAETIAPELSDLPMNVRVVGDAVGRASSIKMIRSVMVKGMEALTAECALAAVAAGVEDEVIPSLAKGQWGLDVAARAGYNFERSLRHGLRRAAEMDEVTRTLADLGLPNGMASETADWQRRIAESGANVPPEGEDTDYRQIAQELLALMRRA